MIITLQDLQKKPDLATAIKDTTEAWLASAELKAMQNAYKYYLGENPKLKALRDRIVADTGFTLNLRPEQPVYSNFFGKITNQHVGHLLKHPLTFDEGVVDKFGAGFQHTVRDMTQDAYIRGVSWGLWDGEKLTHLPAENFIPIYDEESGAIVAGISFKRLREDLPWNYYFYEREGISRFRQAAGNDGKVKPDGKLELISERKPYRHTSRPFLTGEVIESVENPDTFPIRPLHTNKENRSELILPIKTQINAYDLLKTGYIDETLKSKFIYWLISGYSGNIEELIKIKEIAQKLGIIAEQGGNSKIMPQTLEPPHNAHEKIMKELKESIYGDAMAFDSDNLGGRASVAVEAIRASQFNEEIKIGIMWSELEKFIRDIMTVAGIRSEVVRYTPFKLTTGEEARSRSLQGWVDRGLPLEIAIKLDPLVSADIDVDELKKVLATEALGYGNDDEA
ncbi:MAG: phage portal protein [Clostridiales bacterium]|jgi:hypothetical protein|nr:phage portal protein [Clostridiales bacterium]